MPNPISRGITLKTATTTMLNAVTTPTTITTTTTAGTTKTATAIPSAVTTSTRTTTATSSTAATTTTTTTKSTYYSGYDIEVDLGAYFVNDSLLMEINSSSFEQDDNNNFFAITYGNISVFNVSNNATTSNININGSSINGDNQDVVPSTEELFLLLKMIAMSLVLGMMILITIIGNVFVIAAIILERNLQNVANYLVASLAVADLFVACLVMPLGAVYEISAGWILGPELCDIWTSCDVLCCTASILHLVAIAADRYWTVTNIDYNNLRTPRRVFFMIFCVWFAALIVSLAPQFGWKDPEYMQRIEEQTCMVSQDVAYQIFATCCTFYVPLMVILFLYWKIYKIARKRIQRRTQKSLTMTVNESECDSLAQQQQQQKQTRRKKLKQQRQQQKQQQQEEEEQHVERRKRKRLKICFGRECSTSTTTATTSTTTSGIGVPTDTRGADKKSPNTLGVNIETVTVDFASLAITREETEFSTSNYDNKSHAGTEITTVSSDIEDFRTTNASEILTLSHQVASTMAQQQMIATHLNAITPLAQSFAADSGGSGGTGRMLAGHASIANPHLKIAKRRQLLEAKRERKAAQTLAIITGAFVVCWLPFFVMALLLSLCKNCEIHAAIASLFLWLGYFNSTLNPIIYTIFNPEFRRAFQRILFGRQQIGRGRSGKI